MIGLIITDKAGAQIREVASKFTLSHSVIRYYDRNGNVGILYDAISIDVRQLQDGEENDFLDEGMVVNPHYEEGHTIDPDANPLTAATQEQEDIADSFFSGHPSFYLSVGDTIELWGSNEHFLVVSWNPETQSGCFERADGTPVSFDVDDVQKVVSRAQVDTGHD